MSGVRRPSQTRYHRVEPGSATDAPPYLDRQLKVEVDDQADPLLPQQLSEGSLRLVRQVAIRAASKSIPATPRMADWLQMSSESVANVLAQATISVRIVVPARRSGTRRLSIDISFRRLQMGN